MCQLMCLPDMAKPVSLGDVLWQRRKRVKRIVKRRWRFLINVLNSQGTKNLNESRIKGTAAERLEAGDLVRVRSKEEVMKTLNRWNQLKGCSFMEEMLPYCGTTQRVLKRVQKFLDERDYLTKKCSGIVILDGVFCEGTHDFGACDRMCFFFWREGWLEKINS